MFRETRPSWKLEPWPATSSSPTSSAALVPWKKGPVSSMASSCPSSHSRLAPSPYARGMSEQTMAGRTVLVTGASDGIGAEAARVLHARGATVHVTGRSADKLRPVAEAVGTEPLVADFSRLDDVRRLAAQIGERVQTLDLLMNNAGGTFAPSRTT